MSLTRTPFSLERLDTPIGQLLIVTDDDQRVRAVDWQDHEQRLQRLWRRHYDRGSDAIELRAVPARGRSVAGRAFEAYFEGEVQALARLETATNGTTFQRTVWEALREIPVGQTISYRTLAIRIGRPEATRAVGLANGSNPLSIVVPCHRVIGTNGSLTGYGGGLHRKRWLLAHEGVGISTGGTVEPGAGPEAIFTKFPLLAD